MNTLTKLCLRSLSPVLAACLLSCGDEQKVTTSPSNKENFDASTNRFLDLWTAADAVAAAHHLTWCGAHGRIAAAHHVAGRAFDA